MPGSSSCHVPRTAPRRVWPKTRHACNLALNIARLAERSSSWETWICTSEGRGVFGINGNEGLLSVLRRRSPALKLMVRSKYFGRSKLFVLPGRGLQIGPIGVDGFADTWRRVCRTISVVSRGIPVHESSIIFDMPDVVGAVSFRS